MSVIISIQRCRSSLCSSSSSSRCCRSRFRRRVSRRPKCSDSETSCERLVDEVLVYDDFDDAACRREEFYPGCMHLKVIQDVFTCSLLRPYSLESHPGRMHYQSLRLYSLEGHSGCKDFKVTQAVCTCRLCSSYAFQVHLVGLHLSSLRLYAIESYLGRIHVKVT